MTRAQALAGAVDAALAAEQAGLDSVWIAEHLFITYASALQRSPSPPISLAAPGGSGSARRCACSPTAIRWRWPRRPACSTTWRRAAFSSASAAAVPGSTWRVFGTGLDRYEHGFPESLDLLLACLQREWQTIGLELPYGGVLARDPGAAH
jgi:hypothetical protein